jgi:hypothetical protein
VAATREVEAAAVEPAAVAAAATKEAAEKAVCDAYRAADYVEEEDRVAAAALAMAWGLLGKEEEVAEEDDENHW